MTNGSLDNFRPARISTVDQVAQVLTNAVISGELPPGTRLREAGLANRMGVSRHSVREAVRIMEQTGLIHHEPNRGAVVKSPSLEDVEDLYRVREVLELAAIQQVRKGTDLSAVREALRGLESSIRAKDFTASINRDLAFHAAVVKLLGSPNFDRLFENLWFQLRFYHVADTVSGPQAWDPDGLIKQHADILEALERGDRRRAATLMRNHLQHYGDRLAAYVRSRD